MISKQRRLEIQTQAVRGFSTWLRGSPPTDTEEGREFNDQLVYVLDVYGEELQRQIDGTAATPDWLNIVAVTSILAHLLKDELLETSPILAEYNPIIQEPQTSDEMIARLLTDAVYNFEKFGRLVAIQNLEFPVDRILIGCDKPTTVDSERSFS